MREDAAFNRLGQTLGLGVVLDDGDGGRPRPRLFRIGVRSDQTQVDQLFQMPSDVGYRLPAHVGKATGGDHVRTALHQVDEREQRHLLQAGGSAFARKSGRHDALKEHEKCVAPR